MSDWALQAKRKLFLAAASAGFVDPVSGGIPSSEIELSGILCLCHQFRRVDWTLVPLLTTEGQPSGSVISDVVAPDAAVVTEYLLIADRTPIDADRTQIDAWGDMRADLLFIARDGNAVTLFENKIGSPLTHGRDPKSGQIGRQIDYLCSAKPGKKTYVLVTGKSFIEYGWYYSELTSACRCDDRDRIVQAYLLHWEDVFAACRKSK